MKITQVELYEIETGAEMICWIPSDPRVKLLTRLTLKAIPDRIWEVQKIYREIDNDNLNRNWKVGGIQ